MDKVWIVESEYYTEKVVESVHRTKEGAKKAKEALEKEIKEKKWPLIAYYYEQAVEE